MHLYTLILVASGFIAWSNALDAELIDRAIEPRATFTASGVPPPCSRTAFPVPNGDFETGNFDGWNFVTPNEPNYTVSVVSPGYNSVYAAQLSLSYGHAGPEFSVDVDLCSAGRFLLEFDYMMPQTVEGCLLEVATGGLATGGQYRMIQKPWTHARIHLAPRYDYHDYVNVSVVCLQVVHNSATVMVDNFQFTQLPGSLEPNGCPRAVSIQNGGFEYGNLTGWDVEQQAPYVNSSLVSPGHGPNNKFLFQADFHPFQSTQDSLFFGIFHPIYDICIAYNYTYTFTYMFDGYDTADYPDYCTFSVNAAYCLDPITLSGPILEYFPLANTWTAGQITCGANENGKFAPGFGINCGSNGSTPIYNFTKFSFKLDNVAIHLDAPGTS